MTIVDLLTQPLTIVSRTFSDQIDEYGNELPDETLTSVVGSLQQLSGTLKQGYIPEATDLLFLPPGTLIDENDTVIDKDGLVYSIIGIPNRVWNPVTKTEHHIEITLKRIGGEQQEAS